MIKFQPKNFSSHIISGAIKGAGMGATVGGVLGGIGIKAMPKFIPGADKYNSLRKDKPLFEKKNGKLTDQPIIDNTGEPQYKRDEAGIASQKMVILGTSTLIGAALGALFGAIKDVNSKLSRFGADNRLMSDVLKELKRKSFKEDIDFTRDPKLANDLRTKVCILITRDAANLKTVVNTVDDPKLKQLSDKIVKGLTGKAQVRHNQTSNKFNEITISTISNCPSNVKTVTELATGFIKAGYPVYLVEVG